MNFKATNKVSAANEQLLPKKSNSFGVPEL
jgi:hypothetical protein